MKFSDLTPQKQAIIKTFAAPLLNKEVTQYTIFTKQELRQIREVLDNNLFVPFLELLQEIRQTVD